MISREKANYAAQMNFMFQIIIDGERHVRSGFFPSVFIRIEPEFEEFDPFYDELVFVHSEEDAEGFPDNVIVAWPSEVTMQQVQMFNLWAKAPERDWMRPRLGQRDGLYGNVYRYLSDHNLEWPVNVENFVDNWEDIYTFLERLSPNLREAMGSARGLTSDFIAPTLEEFMEQFE